MTAHDNNGKAKTSLGSVLVGAAIGAAAVTLMNKNNRKKLKDGIKDALEKGDKKLDELQDKAMTVKEKAKAKAVKELNKTERKIAGNL